MSVVSSDDAPVPLPSPLPLSSLFLTHWPCTCSLFLLPITRSSVLCASCYMSMSLVIKNALWLSHVLVYWIKKNPNIIVINTNNITIHGGSRVLIHNYSCVCCGVTILQWQWLWGLERHISTAIHLRITWLWLRVSHSSPPSSHPVSGIVFHFFGNHTPTRQHGWQHTASTYNGLVSIRPRPSIAWLSATVRDVVYSQPDSRCPPT